MNVKGLTELGNSTYHSRAGANRGIEVVAQVGVHIGTADVGSACHAKDNA